MATKLCIKCNTPISIKPYMIGHPSRYQELKYCSKSCGKRSDLRAANPKLYGIWKSIKARCLNPSQHAYKDYGGRGIEVCDKWKTFSGFYEDMGSNFRHGLSIERIDNNGHYEPSNCRWATAKEQANNTRRNRKLSYRGMTKNLCEWTELTGLKRTTISQRIDRYRWSVEKALSVGAIL